MNFRGNKTGNESPWPGRLMLAIFVSLLAGPLLVWGLQDGLSLWQTAAAIHAVQSGNRSDESVSRLAVLAKTNQSNAAIQLAIAREMYDLNRYEESAAMALRAVELHRGLPMEVPNLILAAGYRTNALLAQGMGEDAIRELNAIDRLLREDYSGGIDKNSAYQFTNLLAYTHAVADIRVQRGQLKMAMLFEEMRKEPFGNLLGIGVVDQVIAATTLLATETGDFNEILPVLNAAIDNQRDVAFGVSSIVREEIYRWMRRLEIDQNSLVDVPKGISEGSRYFSHERQVLALLLTVRALALEKAGDKESRQKSMRDRQEVNEIGLDSAEIVKALPSPESCLVIADNWSGLVDTNAYLLFRNSENRIAKLQMDAAIAAVRTSIRSVNEGMGEPPGSLAKAAQLAEERNERLAVLLKHRSELLGRLGETELMDQDRDAIRILGFDPDRPDLF